MTTADNGSPVRRRKTLLTPPINDPPMRGTGGVWPDIIATVRPLPPGPSDDGPQGLGIWFNDRPVVRIPEMAAWFNEMASRAGFHIGMVCGTDWCDIWETVPGECDRAERCDRGPIGQWLRVLKTYGGFHHGATPEQHARAIRATILENNTAIVEVNERVLRLAPPKRDLGEVVWRCERLIYDDPAPVFIHASSDLPTAKPTREPRKEFDAQRPYNYAWIDPVPAGAQIQIPKKAKS